MNDKIKVLVVDDSGFVRSIVSKRLGADAEIEVVGTAGDGIEAVEKVKALKPHVVTMDVMMPRMNGLTALEHIMAECPTSVIMLSALTKEGAETTIKAFELGAIDYFLKPSVLSPAGDMQSAAELLSKIKLAARAQLMGVSIPITTKTPQHEETDNGDDNSSQLNKVVVIGSSTGGPRALMQVIPNIPADIPAAILIVQHMPPLFTKSLAERLQSASRLKVIEAQKGDTLKHGKVLLAPGDYHMVVTHGNRIQLHQEPPVWGVRPSVDITMESVAREYGSISLGVVLTGMGVDGTRGASFIKAVGGQILAEDESTCTVYGMPMSVAKAGHVDHVVPLHIMASKITHICMEAIPV
jgi:two-component system chemotaxis response regulator CheB